MDQYLGSPIQSDENARAAVGLAMRYYELAARAFNLTPLTPIDLKNTLDIEAMLTESFRPER